MEIHVYIVVALLALCHGAHSDNSTSADTCDLEPWDSGPWGALLEDWATAPALNERHGRIMALPPAPGYYVTDRVDRPPPPPPPHHGPPIPHGPHDGPHGPHHDPHGHHHGPHGPPPNGSFPPGPPPPDGPFGHGPPPDGPFGHGPPPDGPFGHGPPPPNGLDSDSPTKGPFPYEEWSEPKGGKIVNRPGAPYKDKDKFKPSYPPPSQNQQIPGYYPPPPPPPPHHNQGPPHHHHPQGPQYPPGPHDPHRGPGPMGPPPVDRVDEPPRKTVTETDLYLLSAIEKLVYRVDLMEKRLRKIEDSVHYIVAGQDKKPDPCVTNFTRVGESCYHFSTVATDWKAANLMCRKLRSNLLELDTDGEKRTMFAAMLGDKRIRGTDVWTGGLNPGLLWIWAHSARPVAGNGTAAGNTTIVGEGRCLALVHDPALNTYVYRGQDCALRHRYICEKEEDRAKLSNEIERVARQLYPTARQARALLTDAIQHDRTP